RRRYSREEAAWRAPFSWKRAAAKAATRQWVLEIHQQPARIFLRLFDADEEGHSAFAIDDTVIVAEGQIHHRADHDLTIHHHRAVLDLVHPQNTRLRRVQDRRGHQGTVNAAVRDGEA